MKMDSIARRPPAGFDERAPLNQGWGEGPGGSETPPD
jgi:hypothetical protein